MCTSTVCPKSLHSLRNIAQRFKGSCADYSDTCIMIVILLFQKWPKCTVQKGKLMEPKFPGNIHFN